MAGGLLQPAFANDGGAAGEDAKAPEKADHKVSAQVAEPVAPAPAPAPAAGGPRAPFELERTLSALQDQTGVGNAAAHAALRPLIRRIGEDMAKAPLEAWKEPKNARALVSFVLSGGEPSLLKRLIDDKVELGGIDPNLAAATVAFAERRSEEAVALLSKINVRELRGSLAAHVALVQGIVMSERQPEEAIKNFDLARLYSPGTLVEQGALRRETMVMSKLGRWDEAEKLAKQYLRRFGRAVYAPSFYREIAEQIAGQPDTRDESQFARLVTLFNMIDEPARRRTYLLLAERSVMVGKVKMARFAAARASELYDPESVEGARLQVYGAAADVATDKTPDGLSTLQAVDRRKLGASDSLLADAAFEVGEDVRREPIEEAAAAKVAASLPESATAQISTPTAVMELARKKIGTVDDLLKAAQK